MKTTILGYYTDHKIHDEELSAKTVYVAFEVEGDNVTYIYSPTEQHDELKDKRYLEECEQITMDQYKELGKLFYTPIEYLN